MRIKLSSAAVAAAIAAFAITPAGATAAHCQSAQGDSPGFSYFGTTHVQNADHNGEEAGQPEGQGAHAGTSGASNCRETTGSPSERAPGQN
jgi:hypothetical protein